MEKKQKKFLTVAPFECAWRDDLRFKEAGRGCVAFEAFAHNDVTVVFREQLGSQHYHYKRDNSPHYTVIIGSHRNRRLKIEVDGITTVDEAGLGLCCSSAFQSYWISVCDGLISIGKGRYPFQNLVFQWLDTKPNCSVQYVGLSSWDKHVGYRNVNVLPLTQNHISLWKHVDCGEYKGEDDMEEDLRNEFGNFDNHKGLGSFLESWELSDVYFIVGEEERAVPAHKPHCGGPAFPSGLPANVQRLEQLYMTGEFSDVDIRIEGHGLIARSHKVILGLWSLPFMKTFAPLPNSGSSVPLVLHNTDELYESSTSCWNTAIRNERNACIELFASCRSLCKGLSLSKSGGFDWLI
nr:BTB/POZ domain-containing protein At2g30600 [Tanacetum cinerariifolium]